MRTLKASVVVPAYNASRTLAACLAALSQQSLGRFEYEIIVVDDGSSDDTAGVAAQFPVRLITQPNRGPAAARNLGTRNAVGEIVLFTDADTEPTFNWIQTMLRPFRDPLIAGAKGTYRTRQKALMARFVQIEYEEKYARMARAKRIDVVDTYSAAYRREVALVDGGFDESFPSASAEDQEFSFRLAKQGYRLVFVPEAIVFHQHAASLAAYVRRKFKIGYWKAHVHRRHPDKVVSDTHTPPTLKVQVLLVPLLFVSGAGALVSPVGGLVFVVLVILFALSAASLTWRALRQDPLVGLVAPAYILSRAVALSAGFAAGMLGEMLGDLRLRQMLWNRNVTRRGR